MFEAKDIAEWFVNWAHAGEEPSDVTNLKLQKLLYYAQAHHLGQHEIPLFGDSIQAWSHGPVVPSVYRAYKAYGSNPVQSVDPTFSWEKFPQPAMEYLATVWNTYGQYSAWQLRNMTHSEKPWASHFDADKRGVEIPKESMLVAFRPFGG
ncbi:Panacea domain-containing protein [Arthrobacter sp. SO3]|uniref:Panacea domain-containing protein n=1 Tax=Arthrobacter sp. SO3 TaxID=1897057 RepID=UPI001CFFF5F8|nr:type II toxin-antitoxin system antitoxin SocA domain-containing protein [Arthrobacter sp. SO3]MCB5292609.1 hypothetical protein [Arthrobacter sp. SO3]